MISDKILPSFFQIRKQMFKGEIKINISKLDYGSPLKSPIILECFMWKMVILYAKDMYPKLCKYSTLLDIKNINIIFDLDFALLLN